MASVTRNPTAATSDSTYTDWPNPTNVYASDNAYTELSVAKRQVVDTANHISTGFGFAIPAGATIDGIKVDVERKKSTSAAGTTCNDNLIRLTKDGSIGVGTAGNSNAWPTTEAYQTFGGPTDKWGQTWTVAEINASTFGFMFSASLIGSSTTGVTASVDHVRITIYYTEATPPASSVVPQLTLTDVGL